MGSLQAEVGGNEVSHISHQPALLTVKGEPALTGIVHGGGVKLQSHTDTHSFIRPSYEQPQILYATFFPKKTTWVTQLFTLRHHLVLVY